MTEIEKNIQELKDKVNSKISEATKGLATKEEIAASLEEIHSNFDTTQKEAKEQADRLEKALESIEKQGELITMLKENGGESTPKSFKETIFNALSSDSYKSHLSKGARGSANIGKFEHKAVGDMTSGGNLDNTPYPVILPDRRREPLEILDRPRFLREVMARGVTTKDKIDFVKEQNREGTPAMATEVATSAQIDFELADASVDVERLAAHLIVSRNMLDDIPYLANMIARTGTNRLLTVEDNQILFGDGSTPNLQGITGVASAFSAGNFANSVKDATEIDVVRVVKNAINVAYYDANLIILNPEDIAKMDLNKDANGQYVMYGPRYDANQPSVWRIPVFETTAMTAGKYLIGDFQNGVELVDRRILEISMSESHGNIFLQNKVAFRMEERIALPIYRNEAFVYGTFEDNISDITQ